MYGVSSHSGWIYYGRHSYVDIRSSTFSKSEVTGYISSQHASPLRELTCHIASHSVTCHPARQRWHSRLYPSQLRLVLDLATQRDARLSWPSWLGYISRRCTARRWSPIPVLTGLNDEQLCSCDERCYYSAKPPTNSGLLLSFFLAWSSNQTSLLCTARVAYTCSTLSAGVLDYFLARSANLPERLYILPMFFFI